MGELLAELSKKVRTVDQTLSMHCILRDRFGRWAWILDTTFLVLSALISVLTFFDTQLTRTFGVNPEGLRLAVGIAALGLFLASLISVQTALHRKSHEHRDAAKVLGRLKAKGKTLKAREPAEGEVVVYLELVDTAFNDIVPIPESKFLSLKAAHRRKVRVSEFLDQHPSAGPRLAAIRFWVTDVRATIVGSLPGRSVSEDDDEGTVDD